jgi:hypothetical protein
VQWPVAESPLGVVRSTTLLIAGENSGPPYEATVPTGIGPDAVWTVHVAVVSNVGHVFVR